MFRHRAKNWLGYIGEYLVILLFLAKLRVILYHRYRSPVGEIDLIAKKRNLIVFAEVKTSIVGSFNEIPIGTKQRRSIIRAAKYFLASNPQFAHCDISFEVYCLSLTRGIIRVQNPWNRFD